MEQLFLKILNMSLISCIIILSVILIRLLLRKAPKIFSYALWLIVLFRLLCPVSFSAAFSLLQLLPVSSTEQGQVTYISENFSVPEVPDANQPVSDTERPAPVLLPDKPETSSANPANPFLPIAVGIWLCGSLIMVLYALISYRKLKKSLKSAVPEQKNVYRIPGTSVPFVCGFFVPHIYLPDSLGEEEKNYILMHEQIHIRRGDHFFRLLAYLALCIHWFNPLVWAAFFLSEKDMEMSCDEAVIKRLGQGIKKEYSASLLSFASGRRIVSGIPPAFGESNTGSRIKNVLHYKKPANIVVGIAAILCLIVAGVLIANPHSKTVEKETEYYGVVSSYTDMNDTTRLVVTIPRLGDVELPDAKEIYPYIEIENFTGVKAGDLVKITFPKGADVSVAETDPATFQSAADSIVIMGQNFALRYENPDRYLITLPLGRAPEAKAGDLLNIYHNGNGTEELLAAPTVLSVNETSYDIWVNLSTQETETYLSEFGDGITYELIAQDDTSIDAIPAEVLLQEPIMDGTYAVYICSLSRSPRGIDRYIVDNVENTEELPFLAFADDCTYMVNAEMDRIQYKEVSFDEFADLLSDSFDFINPALLLTFENERITKAVVQEYYGSGISFSILPIDTWYQDIQDINEMDGETVLSTYYHLVRKEQADIGDGAGLEQIEIYTGDIGDGDSGVVLFYDAAGHLTYTLGAHRARVGWNNIYLGERDGTPFLMIAHIEDRDTYGEYSYYIFRLNETGTPVQIAGSSFTFGEHISYDDDLFHQWADTLEGYLADSKLLLSTQEGEIRTEAVSEADKYNYETLHRGSIHID